MAEFTHVHRLILDELPEGSGDPATAQDIASAIGADPSHATAPEIRDKIRELIALGVPVGGGQDGYFIIQSRGSYISVAEGLWSRANQILSRLENLRRAWKSDEAWRDELLGEEEESQEDLQPSLFQPQEE